MANLARLWKEEEIQQVKEALEVQEEVDYSSLINSLFSGFQSKAGVSETALAVPAAIAGGVLAAITAVGAVVSIPAVLSVVDTAIDIDDWYENYKEKWQNDPDNADWYTDDIKRKNNIKLGDALCYGSDLGQYIEKNEDGSYRFDSLLRAENINMWLGRALNKYRTSGEKLIPSNNPEEDKEFNFEEISLFNDWNLNLKLGRAFNYGCSEKHRVIERFDGEAEQYDFKKCWKYHAINNEDFKLYLTSELKAISGYFNISENNFVTD